MYDRRNSYLDRRSRDMARNRGMRDGRNPYGSRGGYVTSDRSNGNDYGMDYNYDYAERGRGNDYRRNSDYRNSDYARGGQYNGERGRHMDYEMYGYGMISPMHYDYARGGRGRDYNDYNYDYARDYADMEKEYHEELKKAIDDFKRKDNRIGVSKDQVIRQAKNMNVRFDDYTEEEFYLVYLMLVVDDEKGASDYNIYIDKANKWLKSPNTKVKGSDKLCTYLYEIVLGKSKEEDD